MPHLARHHQNSATGRVVLLKKEQYTCTQKAWFGIPLPVSVALENLLNLNNLWLSISSLVEERDIYVYTTQSWSRGQITMVNSMLGNKFKSSTWIFYFLLFFFFTVHAMFGPLYRWGNWDLQTLWQYVCLSLNSNPCNLTLEWFIPWIILLYCRCLSV